MKQKLILFTATLLMAVFTFNGYSQEKKQKEERHIKIVKVENGKKVELDTVLTHGNVFVWNGDTIGKKTEVKDGKGKVIVMSSKGKKPMGYTISTEEGDSIKELRVISHLSSKDLRMKGDPSKTGSFIWVESPGDPGVPPPPPPPGFSGPKIKKMKTPAQKNIIDLSDPGIISYEKKKLKDGREKIIIIRKEVKNDPIVVEGMPIHLKRIKDDHIKEGKQINVEVETETKNK